MRKRLALALAAAVVVGGCSTPRDPSQAAAAAQPTMQPPQSVALAPQPEATPQQRSQLRTDLAAGYYERGQFDVALEELGEAVRLDPANARAYNIYGLIYAVLGEDAKAEQNLQRALSLAPNDSEIHHNWGWYLCTHGKARESLAEFETALRNPLYRSPEIALVNAARCATSIGDVKAAEAYYRRALAAAPGGAQRVVRPRPSRLRGCALPGGAPTAAARGHAGRAERRSAVPRHVHRAPARRQAERAFVRLAAAQPLSGFGRDQGDRIGNLRVSQYEPAPQPGADTSPAQQGLAGNMLRNAREAAGLSIDEVAHQLKLAPKQVVALEENDFTHLPGRTFVRGFARNYARLLQLDPQAVIDALPGASGTGGLESPALHATTVSIGELPSEAKARAAWLGWLVLAAVIAAAAYTGWQYLQGQGLRSAPTPAAPDRSTAPAASAPAAPPTAASAPDAAGTSGGGVALPNPVASTVPGGTAATNERTAPAESTAPAAGATTDAANASLTVAVRTSSWIEVKDATGTVALSQTLGPGQSQSIAGTPPLDIVVGNASDVTLTYRGQPVDLAPYTRANVARLRLQ